MADYLIYKFIPLFVLCIPRLFDAVDDELKIQVLARKISGLLVRLILGFELSV